MALVAVAAVAFAAPSLVLGHGAVTIPRPRNAIDSNEAPWSQGVPNPVPFEPWCPFPSAAEAGKNSKNLTGANGQACYWFSVGCAIGCESCDGTTRGPVPPRLCTMSASVCVARTPFPGKVGLGWVGG